MSSIPTSSARRILVYGVTGSGKSTLAERIAARAGLPCHLVDELTWEPGWVPVPADEQRRRVEAICVTDRWVLDNAYGSWREVVLRRVDLIVGLDYPRWLSLSRLLRRTAVRVADRRRICNGNVESLRLALSRDSIVAWHFRSFARKRARMLEWEADGRPILRFTTRGTRSTGSRPSVLPAPHQLEPGPVRVDRGHLDVHQTQRERRVADRVLGDVADVAGRLARPGDPERAGREDPLAPAGQRVEFGAGPDERDHQVGRVVGGDGRRRVVERPPGRRAQHREPAAGGDAELARLRRARVAGHRRAASQPSNCSGVRTPSSRTAR